MPNSQNGKDVLNVRQINMDEVRKYCTYHMPKGVKMKDYIADDNENSKKFCIIGIGGGGINIVEAITKDNSKYCPMMTHIDHQDLYNHEVENKLYIMSDIEDKEILTIENRRELSKFVSAHKEVYVITTLGRDTHSSEAVEKIMQHLYRIHRTVTLIVVKPFLFEVVPGRIRAINETLKKLEKYAEKIFVFHNEDLLAMKESSTLSMPEVFSSLDNIIASVIEEGYECGDKVVSNIYLKELMNERC